MRNQIEVLEDESNAFLVKSVQFLFGIVTQVLALIDDFSFKIRIKAADQIH